MRPAATCREAVCQCQRLACGAICGRVGGAYLAAANHKDFLILDLPCEDKGSPALDFRKVFSHDVDETMVEMVE